MPPRPTPGTPRRSPTVYSLRAAGRPTIVRALTDGHDLGAAGTTPHSATVHDPTTTMIGGGRCPMALTPADRSVRGTAGS